MKEASDALNNITDIVLAYRPKPKTKAVQKREERKPKEKKKSKSSFRCLL